MAASRLNSRYKIVRPLGQGGEGDVYLARDGERELALKVVHDAEDPAARARLAGEFRLLARLDHPRLVKVHELDVVRSGDGLPKGTLFFTADRVAGEPPPADAAPDAIFRIACDVASALAHIHAAGLVHHDVKPANLIVGADGHATLLDLGLGAAARAGGLARGTPAYMAPEAFVGGGDPRSDLYALGATLHELATGAPPFATTGEVGTLVRAILAGPAPVAPRLPAPFGRLVQKLLAPRVSRRPPTAVALLGELAAVAEACGWEPPAPEAARPTGASPFVGRDDSLAALAGALDAFAAGRAGPRAILLVGPPGAGRTRLFHEAIRQHQLEGAAGLRRPLVVVGDRWPRIAAALGLAAAGVAADERGPLALAERAAAALPAHHLAAGAPVVVHLADAGDDPRSAALVALAVALAGESPVPALIVAEVAKATPADAAMILSVGPLAPAAIGELAGAMLGPSPPGWSAGLARATGGIARLAVEAIREAAARGGFPDPRELLGTEEVAAPPSGPLVAALAVAVEGEVAALAALAGVGLDEAHAELAALVARGAVVLDGGIAAFPSPAHQRAAYRAVPEERRVVLHRTALAAGPPPRERARHLALVGDHAAADAAREAAVAARAEGDLAGAWRHLAELGDVGGAQAILRAELAIMLGRYDDAAAAARRAGAKVLEARALQRGGDLDGAAAILAGEPGDEARGLLARIEVARGRFADALAVAGAPEDEPDAGPLRLEAAGLAALYSGDGARADRCFARLEAAARDAGDGVLLGRALSLVGLAAHTRGDIAVAAGRYAAALDASRAAGDVHGAAACALNRATCLLERGRFAEARAATGDAIRDLRRIGRVNELPAALFNRGLALLALGELEAARLAADAARAEAEARALPLFAAYANLLDADVARREGDRARALAAADRALAACTGPREQALAHTSRAEVLAEDGRAADADLALAEARRLAPPGDDADRLTLAAARVAIALGRAGDPTALVAAAARARESGRLDLAWRAELAAARLEAEPRAARAALERAQQGMGELAGAAPGIASDPDARALDLLGRRLGLRGDVTPPPAPAAEPRLRRLLALSKRLNSELRVEPLLDDIIDTVIELTSAERGFLLLAEGKQLEIRVARNIDHRAVEGDLAVSRSIAERAIADGEPVLTVDAAFDSRFGAAASVSAMKLRSVLAVPLRVKGRVVGAIYVDHRFRRGAFTDDAVELVVDLADVAAIALANAQLAADAERARAEIADLNNRLVAELDGARAALAGALELRYPYDALVGRSPRMLDVLRLVDRATPTALPVHVCGESGTGKELVARALHENGPRKLRPFVPLNCAAVPETLLEAELFGHARGAFTGADRDRRGLFEVADGGTLFLDEIGEMPASMQAKLLRILADGEVRRIGGERGRVVDVRIVSAANRDLRELTKEGRFREDLFYRLHVVRIDMPPLRERAEDVPALVEHFIGRGTGPRRRIDRAALGRLAAYAWPGNVRELENELARAFALGGDVIRVADLSPHVAAADPASRPVTSGDLSLRPRVEQLERSIVREALTRAHGNQTAAAKLLGLSRFGLQKKMKRYRIKA